MNSVSDVSSTPGTGAVHLSDLVRLARHDGVRVHRPDSLQAVRSLGHWNPDDQVEVFEVLSGRVLILVAFPGDPTSVSAANYGTGDGGWTLTPADPRPDTGQLGYSFPPPRLPVTELLTGCTDDELARLHQDILAAYPVP